MKGGHVVKSKKSTKSLHPTVCSLTNIYSLIMTEEKAKVVASVWGEEFIQFLAAPAFCLGRF